MIKQVGLAYLITLQKRVSLLIIFGNLCVHVRIFVQIAYQSEELSEKADFHAISPHITNFMQSLAYLLYFR